MLPNGTLANANLTSHPDIYFALRGGGSGFGVVTRFDFEAMQHGLFWVALQIMLPSDLSERDAVLGLRQQLDWSFNSAATIAVSWLQKIAIKLGYGVKLNDIIEAFMKVIAYDDANAHAYIAFTWVPYLKAYIPTVTYAYSQPVESPEAFKSFNSITHVSSSARLAQMSDLVREIEKSSPKSGLR